MSCDWSDLAHEMCVVGLCGRDLAVHWMIFSLHRLKSPAR
jgi:hypothetical protein